MDKVSLDILGIVIAVFLAILLKTFCCTGAKNKDDEEIQAIIPYDPVYV